MAAVVTAMATAMAAVAAMATAMAGHRQQLTRRGSRRNISGGDGDVGGKAMATEMAKVTATVMMLMPTPTTAHHQQQCG
jgi:hypothetical protein